MNIRHCIRLFLATALVVGVVLSVPPVFAENACEKTCNTGDKDCLTAQSAECQKLIDESKGQQQTLATTISFLNSKIKLTGNQIYLTELEIDQLEKDIASLAVRIDGLETSLTRLTEVLIDRVQEGYKQKTKNPMLLLLTSNGISEFVSQYKYLKLSQDYTQKIMNEAETQKVLYGEQKASKEQKQAEVESLKKKLQIQRNSLAEQEKQKQSLLAATQNDERKYQQLKAQAEAQLRAFSGFVQTQGGSSILTGQTSCDGWGCYYNQRDAEWGNKGIGLSSSSMKEYGCLVTSMAMISTHYGKNLKPGDIAGSVSPFFGSTAYMVFGSWSVNGVTMSRTSLGSSTSTLDAELAAGRPVVVGLYGGPDHFIVIKEKKDGNYIMNDPYMDHGKDIVFTEKYPLSAIRRIDRVSVN